MSTRARASKSEVTRSEWFRSLSKYEKSDLRIAGWQFLNTLVPYLILWILMVAMVRRGFSYWCVLPLVVVAAGLAVRIFIIFHDCCHGSFFGSRRANRLMGYLTGILVFTPYESWRHAHALHHATAGDLDRRGVGDIWTMTVDEYLDAPRGTQIAYRLFRSPFVLFILGPPLMFLIGNRFPHLNAGKEERRSVAVTNLAILAIVGLSIWTFGLRAYLMIQIPITCIAGTLGVWLFYVQHQFEGVYWARHPEWDPMRAALEGSSYYRLPRVLQWFSGNIGLHHLHHLRPRIPNYHLQRCYDEVPEVQVEPLTIRRSLKSLRMNVWDETRQQLVSFRAIKERKWQSSPVEERPGPVSTVNMDEPKTSFERLHSGGDGSEKSAERQPAT
jgi:acyl-lipid omega-6 desaturase (Delta-12 desaturase)